MRAPVTIACAGHWMVTHDAIGPRVAELLRGRYAADEVELVDAGTSGLAVLDCLRAQDLLIVVDAARGKGAPGTVHLSQGCLCFGSATLDRCMTPCPKVGVPCFSCGGPSEAIILEPQKDTRSEVAKRMAHLTRIPEETIVAEGLELGQQLLEVGHAVLDNQRDFLQTASQQASISQDDWQEALQDVSARLDALGNAVTGTMGRGQRAVGRKAGALAAHHMPEIYEATDLSQLLERLRERFAHAFAFEFGLGAGPDAEVGVTFHGCGLAAVVGKSGQPLGDAVLCALFHEYWAGLVGAFASTRYRAHLLEAGVARCQLTLTPS